MNSGIYYFDVEESTLSSCDNTTLVGSMNEEKAWNYFVGKGLEPHLVAGILGNLTWESGINPVRIQGGGEQESQDPSDADPLGWGLMQWTPGSKIIDLMEQANINTPVYELSSQLDLVWWHLNNVSPTGRSNVIEGFRRQATVEDATIYFEDYMEGAGKPAHQQRIQIALDIFQQYGSMGIESSGAVVSTCGGSNNQVVGGYSLPVDMHWYESNQEWFTKTHHDYPAADIPVPTGTPIYSMTAGTIVNVSAINSRCGLGISIETELTSGETVRLTYCHSSDAGTVPGADLGDEVAAGQLIMNSNNTGNSSGPHLHLGLKIDGVNTCPQDLFVGIAEGSPPNLTTLPTSGCTH